MNKEIKNYLGEMGNIFDGAELPNNPIYKAFKKRSFEDYKEYLINNVNNWKKESDFVDFEYFIYIKIDEYVTDSMISLTIVQKFFEEFNKIGINKELDLFKKNFGLNKDEWAIVEFNGLVIDKDVIEIEDDNNLTTDFIGNPESNRKILNDKIKNDFGDGKTSVKKLIDKNREDCDRVYQEYFNSL